MEIVNFFEKLAGRWFSQRTTHALTTQQSKAGKSDLEVEFLAADDEAVKNLYQTLCQPDDPDPLCGLRIAQSSTVDGDTKPKVSTTLLVPLTPHTQNEPPSQTATGMILRGGSPGQNAIQSDYTLEDEVFNHH